MQTVRSFDDVDCLWGNADCRKRLGFAVVRAVAEGFALSDFVQNLGLKTLIVGIAAYLRKPFLGPLEGTGKKSSI